MNTFNYKRFLLGSIGEQYSDDELDKMPDSVYRDLYLKQLNLGKMQGPLTGNVYIDKPWTINYLDEPLQKIIVEETLYNNYINANSDNLDAIAIHDFLKDKTYTHRHVIDMVDSVAAALSKNGCTNVGLFLNNSIEEPVFLLSDSKIGAVSKYVDFTKGVPSVIETVEKSNFDILVMDEALLPMEPIINPTKKTVVVANGVREYDNENYITFEQFLELGKSKDSITVSYKKSRPSVVISSSGTTGPSKPIVHTDLSINAAALKIAYTDYSLGRENFVAKIVPPHIGLGLITTLYTNLLLGTKIVLIDAKSPIDSIKNTLDFVRNFKQFLVEHNFKDDSKLILFASPMYFRELVNDPTITDLSFIGGMLAAGSKMSKDELELIDEQTSRKGCTVPVCNGYGQNEMAGAVTLNSNIANCRGSAGFPTIGTDIRIVEPNNYTQLPIGEEGRVLEKTDSSFLYYDNMHEATEKAKIELDDATYWFDTNDLGHIDENGFQFITGRTSRVVIRCDMKISIDSVEHKVKMLPAVGDCAIVSTNGECMFAYVSLKPEYIGYTVETIISQLQDWLSEIEFPSDIKILDGLPYMSNGKIDYVKLNEMAKSENVQKVLH